MVNCFMRIHAVRICAIFDLVVLMVYCKIINGKLRCKFEDLELVAEREKTYSGALV